MKELEKYIGGKELFADHYRLKKLLSSEGGTADVWLAENAESVETEILEGTDDVVRVEGTGVEVAIKIYRPKNIMDVDGEQNFKSEYKTIFSCHHANLLPISDYSTCDGMPYLVMPYCEKGSAEQLVGKLTDAKEIWKFLSDVASGLAHLHSCEPPIIHQDIKPANILIDTNNNYCITDFGISVKTGVGNEYYLDNRSSGTTIYMPPERFDDDYEPKAYSDIWSLGATVYELISGDVPFGNEGGQVQKDNLRIPPLSKSIPKKIRNLIYSCLDPKPEKRPTAKEIAETASNEGKKSHYKIWISLCLLIAVISVLLLATRGEKKVETYVRYNYSGDSIINLQKQETNGQGYIDYKISVARFNQAIEYYKLSIKERKGKTTGEDSIYKKIYAIRSVFPLMEKYKGVCDTLDLVRKENLPIQIEIYSGKRDEISELLKNKIRDL